MYRLARAFAFYFELINLAETNHRKRRRRSAMLHANATAQRGSLRGTLRRLREAGLTRQAALGLQPQAARAVFVGHQARVVKEGVE